MRKLKLLLPAVLFFGMFLVIGCKKTTTNTTVVKDSIYYSNWAPLLMTMEVDPSSGDTFYVQTITAPSITANIISHGAILAYYGVPTSATDTTIINEAEMTYLSNAEVTYAPGQIVISSQPDLTYTDTSGYLFRYVVVPANILATTSMNGMTQQQLNKMSFTELQKTITTWQQSSGNTFKQ